MIEIWYLFYDMTAVSPVWLGQLIDWCKGLKFNDFCFFGKLNSHFGAANLRRMFYFE